MDEDRFTIRRTLGAGGMGVVYEAHDRSRGATVALKALRDFDPARLFRFKNEFRVLADLVHPNLATLYELFSIGDEYFFTMELIDGVSFLEHVRPGFRANAEDVASAASQGATAPDRPSAHAEAPAATKAQTDTVDETRTGAMSSAIGAAGNRRERLRVAPLDEARLRDGLGQLAQGVFALHQAGKLHRDIKPSNVLVEAGGRVVLCDFGLATDIRREQADVTGIDQVVGTVAYMSPEQAANVRLTPASDWYSVGVLLYEALTARVPFSGPPRQVLREKQLADAPPVAAVAPDAPSDLAKLCDELLRRDPDARLSGPHLLRRLGVSLPKGSALTPSSSTQRPPLVGRERHLQQLRDAYVASRERGTAIALVHGSSGMGKTVLSRAFVDELQLEEAVVLRGRCYDRESVPYKALDGVIDSLSSYLASLPRSQADELLPDDVMALARLFPVLRRVEAIMESPRRRVEAPDPHEVRRRAFAALRELFRRIANARPLVVCVDDAQWGDVDSAAVLGELLRPPEPPQLLLVVCYRTEDAAASPLVQALIRSEATESKGRTREIALDPLSRAESRALALELLDRAGDPVREHADRIANEAQGSPYFVEELAQRVQSSPSAEVPISLDDVLLDRVRGLSGDSRAVLTAVAVAGRPVAQAVVFRAAAVGGDERNAMERLRAERLVRARGIRADDVVEPFHDRIREALVASLTPAELQHHHRRMAVALQALRPTDAEALVEHWRGAGEPERAGECAVVAARQAVQALAFDHAAELFRLGLELRPLDGEAARRLQVELGDALANAGRGAEAAAAYLRAVPGAAAADALEWRRRAAEELLRAGHIDEGMTTLRSVADAAGVTLLPSPRRALLSIAVARARIALRGLRFRTRDATEVPEAELRRVDVCASVANALGMVDTIRGVALQSRGLLLALRAGEPRRVARALSNEAFSAASAGAGGASRANRLIDASDRLAREIDDHRARGTTRVAAGLLDYQQGLFRAGFEKAELATSIFRSHCTNIRMELNVARVLALWSLYYLGELRDLQHRVPVLHAEAEGLGDRFAVANLCAGLTNAAWLISNDVAGARHARRTAMKGWPSGYGFHLQHYWDMFAAVQIDLYAGQGDAAWQTVSEGWPALSRSMLLRIPMVRTEALTLRARCALAAAARSDERAQLVRRARGDAARIRRQQVRGAASLATLVEAGIDAMEGRTEKAVASFRAAEDGFREADMALHRTVACRRRGELIGGEEGSELISSADSWLARQHVADPGRVAAMISPVA